MRIVKDQIEERGLDIFVTNRESAIWRKASLKTVLRENPLKNVDVEEMRVITKDRCIPEQIKHDKAENVVMDGSKIGTFGKLEICKIDEEMWTQSEERLCKSIMKDTRCWQMWKKNKNKTSYVLTTSLARNCRGMQCAKLANWN